jgi:hypothetical protein
MSEKKHIDRIFQEKLKDLEVSPRENVWDSISQELGHDSSNRKLIPIWWKLIGAAAIIILLFTVGNLIFDQNEPVQSMPITVESENSEKSNTKQINDSLIDPIEEIKRPNINPEKALQNKPESNKSLVESNNSTNNNSDRKQKSNQNDDGLNTKSLINNSAVVANHLNNTDDLSKEGENEVPNTVNTEDPIISQDKVLKEVINQNAIVRNDTDNKDELNKNKSDEIINSKTPEELIVEPEKEKIPLTEEVIVNNEDINEEEEETINRWQIYPNIAPVYYNSLGKGSSLDGQFTNNPKTGELNTSYGVNIGYAINEKITLKTGFNALALSYDTDNVILYQNIGASLAPTASFRNIKIDNSEITMISANNVSAQQVNSILGANSKAAISQRLDYFEIPLEVDYKFVNKKMGVNLIGGFSTFFLRNNEVVSEFDGFDTYIGEATNINNISYSLNFGLGFDFPLTSKMSFNIDPKFKYQINTFKNTSGNFRPYIIGLYTGINYKF